MSGGFTEFGSVSLPPAEKGGPSSLAPAICVWLDADMDEKRALVDYLYNFGPLGRSACQLLLAKDPRLFTHRHPGYGGGMDEFRKVEERHPKAMRELRDKYNVGY